MRFGLNLHIGKGYLGNYVRACLVSCEDAGELLGEAGLLRAARAVQAAVEEMEVASLVGRVVEGRHILGCW